MSNREDELTPKQEEFCKLYATDREFFGNGVQAYIEAYGVDTNKPNYFKTAAACASRLLTNANILDRINELLELRGLNDAFVDKQLELLITQNADLKVKVSAIKEYNALKARVTKKLQLGNDPDNPITQPVDKSVLDNFLEQVKDSIDNQSRSDS